MKQLLLTILFITFILPLAAQSGGETPAHPPKYEVRAAWVTAVYGLAPLPRHHPRRHPEAESRTYRNTGPTESRQLQYRSVSDTYTR